LSTSKSIDITSFFHNIPNVIEMFEQVLCFKLDIDGGNVYVSAEGLLVINDIKQFSGELQKAISAVSAA
jgi:hypothetical protein